MEVGKIMIYNAERDKFIEINPHTDCARCGKAVDVASHETGHKDFRICSNHCAGCQTYSSLPNRIHEWKDVAGEKFWAPGCAECRPPVPDTLEGRIIERDMPYDEVDY